MDEAFEARGYRVVTGVLDPRHLAALAAYLHELAEREGGGFGADPQVPASLKRSGHDDLVTTAVSDRLQPLVERIVGLPLQPTTTFVRIYEAGARLLAHKDKPHCDISCTLPVFADAEQPWPIWLSNEDYAAARGGEGGEVAIALQPGDLLIYRGPELVHWREPLAGRRWTQLMCHYVRAGVDHGLRMAP